MAMFDFVRFATKAGVVLRDPAAVDWAIWLHDIVHNPGRCARLRLTCAGVNVCCMCWCSSVCGRGRPGTRARRWSGHQDGGRESSHHRQRRRRCPAVCAPRHALAVGVCATHTHIHTHTRARTHAHTHTHTQTRTHSSSNEAESAAVAGQLLSGAGLPPAKVHKVRF
jgi:hypothetical protein